jgi:hypothetical protein
MRNTIRLGSVLLLAAAAWSQDPNQDPNQAPVQDPPSRVARLNLIQGQVSFQPATVTDWAPATLNYPITIGDHLYADDDSRAELHVGSTAVRLGARSSMSFMNLDDRLVQVRLDQGALIVRVKYLDGDDAYEIDTAQGAITLLRQGEYRIDTDPDRNATMVTVRSGDAEVTSSGGSFPVHPRQTAFFAGDGQPQIQTENPNDSFDLFSMDLDRRDDRMPPPRYVSRDMPGWQDLETNGAWSDDPEYGAVWRPRVVDADWAPYRYGHWAWIEPWGWTWIDNAAWGFAPFHYGRWVIVGGGWAWIPGPIAPRPVYAPALVAFVGGRGVTAVAWFPLGPREVFVPSYRVSPVYVNRVNVTTVNITNVTVVNRVYVNRTVGVTAVDHRDFVSAQPVHRAMVDVPRDVIARGEVTGAAPVAPQRASVLGHAALPANVPHPAANVMARPVYAQRTPPPAAVPFEARQRALEANLGHPVDPQTVRQLRTTGPVREPAVRTLPAPATPIARPRNQESPAAIPTPAPRPAEQSRPEAQPRPATQPQPEARPRPATQSQPEAQPRSEPQPAAREARPAPHADETTAVKKDNKKKKKKAAEKEEK